MITHSVVLIPYIYGKIVEGYNIAEHALFKLLAVIIQRIMSPAHLLHIATYLATLQVEIWWVARVLVNTFHDSKFNNVVPLHCKHLRK